MQRRLMLKGLGAAVALLAGCKPAAEPLAGKVVGSGLAGLQGAPLTAATVHGEPLRALRGLRVAAPVQGSRNRPARRGGASRLRAEWRR
jgi:hypothetical protein